MLNSLFMVKKYNKLPIWFTCFLIAFNFSCQHKQTKKIDPVKTSGANVIPPTVLPNPTAADLPAVGDQKAEEPVIVNPTTVAAPLRKNEKFGLIFSGGGAKVWTQINVIKNFQKLKIPVVAVAGIEWGAIVAAVYAQNLSPNEVEWEFAKFKEIDDWEKFVKAVFEKKSISGLKVPFVCPSINLKRQSSYLLNRGLLEQLIPFCISSPGLITPYANNIAGMTNLAQIVQHLRANGATKIILINTVTQKSQFQYIGKIDSVENQIWQMTSLALTSANVDETITVNTDNFGVRDFDQRKNILLASSQGEFEQVKAIAEKYGL